MTERKDGDEGPSSSDEIEPVSMRELEMIFAPGKAPPLLKRDATSTPLPAPRAEPPKPPRPPRKAAASPPDIASNDLDAFAAMSGSVPPPKADAESTPAPTAAKERRLPLPKPIVPLKKPGVPTGARAEGNDWKRPPDSALQDLKQLASSRPPDAGATLDFDDILGMKNTALEGALSTPIVPPDMASLLNPPPGTGDDGNSVPPSNGRVRPPRPKKRDSESVTSAVTAPPSEPSKKRKKGKNKSSRPPKGGPVSEAPASRRSERAPRVETKKAEEPRSRAWIALLAAAVVIGGGYLALRNTSPVEPTHPSAEPTVAVETAPPAPTQRAPEKQAAAAPTAVEAAVEPTAPSVAPTARATTPVGAVEASTAHAPATGAAVAPPTAKPPAGGGEFDKSAAAAALGAAVGKAASCKQPGDPSGVAHVQVTFMPSGKVTGANLSGPPFAGTPTGSCIARALKSASVPSFSGDPVTVSKTVQIP